MALSKVTYVDGVTIIGAKNLNDIQDEIILQGQKQAEDEASLAGKAEAADVTAALALKADKSDTYTKSEVDSALALKADKSEVTAALELKADKTETYTKAQVDSMIQEAVEEAVKESEYSNFEMKSVSGDFIHITDGAGLIPVKDLKIGIDAVQEGTGDPSLENIRPITGWIGAKVTVTGKNLLPKDNWGVGTIGISDNKFVLTSSSTRKRIYDVPIKAGTYTVSGESSTTVKAIIFYRADKSVIDSWIASATPKTFVINEKCFVAVASENMDDATRKIQLELGSTATAYEPYNGTTYSVTWEEAGTVYGGVLDVTTGELVVTNFGADLGACTWNKSSNGTGRFACSLDSGDYPQYEWSNNILMICTNYKFDGVGYSPHYYGANGTFRYYFYTGVKAKEIYICDEAKDNMTAAEFKEAMSGVYIVYPLDVPVSYTIDPTEVLTLLGENNIFADTGAIEELIYRISRQ